jgi:ABC-type amino acid transport substrate-binding protein
MSTVINLYGGSGLGKSTTAALVFGEMKLMGLHCELVREFVKEWAWAGRQIKPGDQTEIYQNQLARERLYYGKLDYIVTDSPLVLGPIYQKYYTGTDSIAQEVFDNIIRAEQEGVSYMNFLLKRNKPFDPRGRYESEEQAKEVDFFVEKYLKDKSVPFHTITSDDKRRVDDIITIVTRKGDHDNPNLSK